MEFIDNTKQPIIEQIDSLIANAKNAEQRNTEEALSLSFEALKLAEDHGIFKKAATCYVLIGRCHWINGNFEEAIENFDKALDLCVKYQADDTKVEAIIGKGNVYMELEMFDIALTNYNKALVIAKEQNFDILMSKISNNLGALQEELGNDLAALNYYHDSLNTSLEIDDHYGVAIANLNIGNMNFNLNHISEAKKYLAESMNYCVKNGKTLLLAHIHFTLGSMSQAIKDYDKSIEEFLIGVDKALESKDSKILFKIYTQLAHSYRLKGSFAEAEVTYQKGLDVADRIGMDELKVTVLGKLATFYHENEQIDQALVNYKKYHDTNIVMEENRLAERKKTIDYLSKLSVSLEETMTYQKLSDELKRSYNSMKILSVIGQAMTSTHDIEKIFEKLYENINSLMSADALTVSLYDPEENVLRFDLSIERGKYLGKYNLSLDNKKSLAVWSFLNKEAIRVNDVEVEYMKYIEGVGSTRGELMYSVMVAPLIVEGETIGVFGIQAKERNAYTDAHQVLLQTLASYLAISIKNATKTKELAKLNKILKVKSEKDGLTGISNRRLFDEQYDELWAHAVERQEEITVMILDIDNFKDFNDQYGHLIGDEVIKTVANSLENCRTEGDFVARYGGDEFVAILPNSSKKKIDQFDNDLRELLKSASQILGIETQVTVSIGIASVLPTEKKDSEKLVYTADNQLYKSKANGKNQTSMTML